MNAIASYLTSVVAAAILCATVKALFPESAAPGRVIRMVTGLFLAAVVIAPLTQLRLDGLTDYTAGFQADAAQAAAQGERDAHNALSAIIKQEAEAYILDKAKDFGAALTVNVTVSKESGLPQAVTLTGRVSPYGKTRLEEIITTDLGVAKEQITWTG